jgi:hypothetical protein
MLYEQSRILTIQSNAPLSTLIKGIISLRANYLYGTFKNNMNKKHWNTIMLNGSVPEKEIFSWIDHSYDLVRGKKA